MKRYKYIGGLVQQLFLCLALPFLCRDFERPLGTNDDLYIFGSVVEILKPESLQFEY